MVTGVMTAPPQKLHLMLIDGAIRFVRRARQHWAAKEDAQAAEALIRAQNILGEVLAGFNRELDPELVRRVAAVYGIVYRTLLEASAYRDDARLAEVLDILEVERETWRQLCEQLAAEQPGRSGQFASEQFDRSGTSPLAGPHVPPSILAPLTAEDHPARFSLEA
jgi:flagellar protein FliS